MMSSKNTIRDTRGGVALTVLSEHFLSMSFAGKYMTTWWFLYGKPVHNYRSACKSITNMGMKKLTIMIAIRRLKPIWTKMIALKLDLSFRWNHHTKQFRRSLWNKHTAVYYNEYPWNANDEFFFARRGVPNCIKWFERLEETVWIQWHG